MSKFRYSIVFSGVLLSLGTCIRSSALDTDAAIFLIIFFVWGSVPYVVYWLETSKWKDHGATIGGGLLTLGIDIYIHAEVFFFPGSSTAAIALVLLPFLLLVLVTPVGLLVGWLVGWLGRRFSKANKAKGSGLHT